MNSVFADAYYFIALLNPRDEGHAAAVRFTETFSGTHWTTAWIQVEVANACTRRPARSAFLSLFADLEGDSEVNIVPPSAEHYMLGLRLFAQHEDKEWSLTDCISFIVMKENNLANVLTADHHFEQAGFVPLLK